MPTTGKGGRGKDVERRKAPPAITKEMASRKGNRSERTPRKVGRQEQEEQEKVHSISLAADA